MLQWINIIILYSIFYRRSWLFFTLYPMVSAIKLHLAPHGNCHHMVSGIKWYAITLYLASLSYFKRAPTPIIRSLISKYKRSHCMFTSCLPLNRVCYDHLVFTVSTSCGAFVVPSLLYHTEIQSGCYSCQVFFDILFRCLQLRNTS